MKVAKRDFIPGAAIATLRRCTLRAIILAGMFSSPLLTAVQAQTDLPREPKSQPQVPETLLKRSISIAKEELQNRPNPAKPFRWHGELSHPGLSQTLEPIPPERTRPRQKFAVCVGIDHYAEGPSRDLHYAAADAVAMAEACLKNLQFTKVLLIADIREVPENLRAYIDTGRLVFTDNTTADAIEGELEKFSRLAVGSDDVLAYYHAGHGDSGRTPAVLAGDHTPRAPRRITVNAIIDRLQADEVFAAHRLVILDACRSGLNDNAGRVMSAAFREAFSRPDLRMTVLTGCDSEQSSAEDPELGHGRFTWALLQGIRGQAWRAGEQALLSSDLYIQIAGLFGTKGWNTQQSPQQFQSGSVFALAWRDLPLPQQLDEFEQQKLKEDIESATKTYLSVLTPQHREKARSQCRYALRATDFVELEDAQTKASRARLLELYAIIEYRLGNQESADKWLSEAEMLNPGNTTQSLVAAFRQADEGRVVEASDQLEPLIERLAETANDDIWLWQRIAGIQAAVGDSLGAIVSCGRAAEAVHRLQSDSQLRYDLLWQNLDRQEELKNAIWFELPFTNRIDWLLRADEVLVQTAARTLGPEHGETKRLQWQQDALRRLAQLPAERLQEAAVRYVLHDRLTAANRHKDVLHVLWRIMENERTLLGPTHPWYMKNVYNHGLTHLTVGNTAAAISNLRAALAIYQKAYGTECAAVARCRFELGNAFAAVGSLQEASECYVESVTDSTSLRRIDLASLILLTADRSFKSWGTAFSEKKNPTFESTLQTHSSAVCESEIQFSDVVHSRVLAERFLNRGRYHYLQERYLEATEEFARAEIAFREGNCASDAAWMLNWQGHCWLGRDSEKAVGYYKQAMVEFRTAGEQGVSGVAKNGLDLGTTLLGLSRFDEASAVLAEAVKGYKKLEMPGEVGWTLRLQGDCWKNRVDENALEFYRRAIVEFRAAGEQEVYLGASTCVELGKLLLRLRRFDEASAVFREAASDYEKLASPDNVAWMLYWHGNCWADRDDAKAVALYSQALTLSHGVGEEGVEGVSGVAVYGTALGKAMFRLQRFEEAAELFQEAAKLGIDCAQKNLHAARRAAWAGDAFFRCGNLAASGDCFAEADKLYANNDLPNARIALGMSILTSNPEVAREEFSAVRSCPVPREQEFQPDACLALCLVSLHERMTRTQPADLDEREKELLREAVLTKADGPPRDLQRQRRLAHLLHASKDLSEPLRDAVCREILMLLPADSELRHVYDGR